MLWPGAGPGWKLHLDLSSFVLFLFVCSYLGGRGTLPEPAVLAALPAVVAAAASASSPPLHWYSAEAKET